MNTQINMHIYIYMDKGDMSDKSFDIDELPAVRNNGVSKYEIFMIC
jgi:hypothetical protein